MYDTYTRNSPEQLREELKLEKEQRKGTNRFRTIIIFDGVNYRGKNEIGYLIRSIRDSGGASKKF